MVIQIEELQKENEMLKRKEWLNEF
jgi:hypothetical protein